jgi:hypothetical protein
MWPLFPNLVSVTWPELALKLNLLTTRCIILLVSSSLENNLILLTVEVKGWKWRLEVDITCAPGLALIAATKSNGYQSSHLSKSTCFFRAPLIHRIYTGIV